MRWIVLAIALTLLVSGCGGDGSSGESTRTYYDPTESWQDTTTSSSGYYNPDGSQPRCVTLLMNDERACNTDEEIVLAARAINSGDETLESIMTYYRGECLNAGWGMSQCGSLVTQLTSLIVYNVTHGVPQHE